mgnify:CR=1 FL=1
MNIIMILLAFNFILIIHELGHFVVAKLSKIKVEEFSLFVGPKLFSFTKGETTYSLRLFPILAYVKMEGEDEESESENAFNKKPVWVRAAVIAAGPLANILSAIILITICFYISGFQTMTISKIGEDSPALRAGLQVGDEIIEYDNKRVYQPLDLQQFLYISKGKPTNIKVKRNNEVVELYIEPQVIPSTKRYMLEFTLNTESSKVNVVESVSKGGAADKAGIQKGDRIVKINGEDVNDYNSLRAALQQYGNSSVVVTVERNGEMLDLEATPVEAVDMEQYNVGFAFGYTKGSVLASLKQGTVFAYSNVRLVPYTLGWLFTGKASIAEMVGPVGIVSSMNDAVNTTTSTIDAILTILYMTAYISVAVGATNLVPFPALDGSKLVILAIEAIRRKPIPIEKEAIITTVGFFLLIGLSIFITIKDIANLFGFSF